MLCRRSRRGEEDESEADPSIIIGCKDETQFGLNLGLSGCSDCNLLRPSSRKQSSALCSVMCNRRSIARVGHDESSKPDPVGAPDTNALKELGMATGLPQLARTPAAQEPDQHRPLSQSHQSVP